MPFEVEVLRLAVTECPPKCRSHCQELEDKGAKLRLSKCHLRRRVNMVGIGNIHYSGRGATHQALTNGTHLVTLTKIHQTHLASQTLLHSSRAEPWNWSFYFLPTVSWSCKATSAHICHPPSGGGPRYCTKETHHLDPVSVRVQDERDVIHLAVREALLERHAESLEARTCLLDIGHGDGDVAEPLRLGVSGVIWRRFQRLRAVIVGKFEDAWRADRTRREIM